MMNNWLLNIVFSGAYICKSDRLIHDHEEIIMQ